MPSYHFYTDTELLELISQDDPTAFDEIYRRYSKSLAIYVLKVIESREDTEDIVQEVFVSIWKRRSTLQIKSELSFYLHGAVRNLAIRYIEKNINKRDFFERLAIYSEKLEPSSYNLLELQEFEKKVDNAIGALPPKMREVYYLSRFENLSYREIAEKLGIAETTVKKQISNALKSIKDELGGLSASSILYAIFFLD